MSSGASQLKRKFYVAILTRLGRRIARHQPTLRVIEGGRTQLIDEIARLAENLRKLERALVQSRKLSDVFSECIVELVRLDYPDVFEPPVED